MEDAILLPFEAALPRSRRLPPPCEVPLSREERVELLIRRHHDRYLLWNPDDRLDPDDMSIDGWGGAPRESNGTDKPPIFTSLEAMADAIAQRKAMKKRGAA